MKQRALRIGAPWMLFGILALAAVTRLVALSAHSLLFDEAFVAIGARDIAWNHTPMWDAISNAPAVAIIAYIIRWFGDSVVVLRFFPALCGIATVGATYMLANRLLGKPAALLSAAVLAVHPFAIAFSRILFADVPQALFIVLAWYSVDRYMLGDGRLQKRWYLLLSAILWAAAFLMKYNAAIPAVLWILSGFLAGRYPLRESVIALVAAFLGCVTMLLLWPLDSVIWLAAFADKAGNPAGWSIVKYFFANAQYVFLGILPLYLVGGPLFRIVNTSTFSRAIATLAFFSILYLLTLASDLWGRAFERYLILLAPIASMLLAASAIWIWNAARTARASRWRVTAWLALLVITTISILHLTYGWLQYGDYLHNDVAMAKVIHDAKQYAGATHRVFWLLPEPIGAYYLGFSRFYSRASIPDTSAGANQNYFEFAGVPFGARRAPYRVLQIRRCAHSMGLFSILTHPTAFLDSIHAIQSQPRRSLPIANYLVDTLVHPEDLLIMHSGVTNLRDEPILHNIRNLGLPPGPPPLPLSQFEVLDVYGPSGKLPLDDTTITKYTARVWILRKRDSVAPAR